MLAFIFYAPKLFKQQQIYLFKYLKLSEPRKFNLFHLLGAYT